MSKGKSSGDDGILQTKCWISTEGHMWMVGFFDKLPAAVRQRLRASPFNLCPACLVTKFAPEVRKKQSGLSRERALVRRHRSHGARSATREMMNTTRAYERTDQFNKPVASADVVSIGSAR